MKADSPKWLDQQKTCDKIVVEDQKIAIQERKPNLNRSVRSKYIKGKILTYILDSEISFLCSWY